jgi:hypothetical protein
LQMMGFSGVLRRTHARWTAASQLVQSCRAQARPQVANSATRRRMVLQTPSSARLFDESLVPMPSMRSAKSLRGLPNATTNRGLPLGCMAYVSGRATFKLSDFGNPRAIAGSIAMMPCTGKACRTCRKAPNSIGVVARERHAHSNPKGCPRSTATSPPCRSPTTRWGLHRTTSRSRRTAAHRSCFLVVSEPALEASTSLWSPNTLPAVSWGSSETPYRSR